MGSDGDSQNESDGKGEPVSFDLHIQAVELEKT